jgi:hypothetical protein
VIGGRARRFRFWHEHYNAACVFALPLLSARAAAGETNEYARAAVRRLELATARADSAYLASRRDWLLSEDPDLKGLRTTTAFKNFEVMHLPASEVTPRRPERVQQLESSRYVRALLVATAETWQATWHARGRSLGAPPEIRDVLGWFGDELAMWELVREVALDYRHAGTRHKLITTLRDCADRYRFDPVHVGSPRYETKPLKEDHGSCDDAADREIKHADDVLEAIAKFLRTDGIEEPAGSLLDRLERWQSRLHERAATAREPSRLLIAALCDHHAAMWQLLAAWLQADEAAAELAGKSFREKADETRKLWCTALSGWRMFSEGLLAFAGRGGADHPAPGVVLRYQLRSWSRGRAVGSHNSDGVATARDTFG